MNASRKFLLPLGVAAALVLVSGCGGNTAPTAAPVEATTPPVVASHAPTSADPTSAPATADASASASPAAAGAVDACALVTPEELKPLLGAGVGPGLDTSAPPTAACAFTGVGVTTVVVDPTLDKAAFDADCSTANPSPTITTLTGVGDAACLSIVGGSVAVVYVLKGSDLMSINVQAGGDNPITPEVLTALATSAAGRL